MENRHQNPRYFPEFKRDIDGNLAYLALSNMRGLGNYALESSTSVGERAIHDSTSHLVKLGEETITQISQHVAKQVEMYLKSHPSMTVSDMRNDAELRQIAVQPVGTTGYTTIIDPANRMILIHKFWEQERDVTFLKICCLNWAYFLRIKSTCAAITTGWLMARLRKNMPP
jgi:hypothetical protein